MVSRPSSGKNTESFSKKVSFCDAISENGCIFAPLFETFFINIFCNVLRFREKERDLWHLRQKQY
jgi:hypothetical protein